MIENEITQKIRKLDELYKLLIAPVTFFILIFFSALKYLFENGILIGEKDIFLAPALVAYTTFFFISSIIIYLFAFPMDNTKCGYGLRLAALFFIIIPFILLMLIPISGILGSDLITLFNPPWAVISLSLISLVIVIWYLIKL